MNRNTVRSYRRNRQRPNNQLGRRNRLQQNQRSLNDAGVGSRYLGSRSTRSSVDLTGNWTIVPPEIKTVLPYHEELAVTSGTYFLDRVYSLNGLYDPDITSTGHQPMGFDQWGVFYNHYRVLQTGIHFRVNNTTTASGLQVYLVVNDDPTPITSTPVAGESPYTQELVVGAATGVDIASRERTYNLPQLFGRSLEQYRSEENYSGTFTSNPTQQFYLHVFFRSSDGATAIDANYTLYLSYLSEIYERRKLGLS